MLNQILKEKVEKEIRQICNQLNKIDEIFSKGETSSDAIFVSEKAISKTLDVVNRVVNQNDENTLTFILASFETKMEQSREENFIIRINSCKSVIYSYFLAQTSQFYAKRKGVNFKPDRTPENYFSGFYNRNRG